MACEGGGVFAHRHHFNLHALKELLALLDGGDGGNVDRFGHGKAGEGGKIAQIHLIAHARQNALFCRRVCLKSIVFNQALHDLLGGGVFGKLFFLEQARQTGGLCSGVRRVFKNRDRSRRKRQ